MERLPSYKRKLVIVPSDPISSYEVAGYSSWLESYYNPTGMFSEIYALSPIEPIDRVAYGMNIKRVERSKFQNFLRKIQPDVIRAYGGYWPADLVCKYRFKRTPVIISVHDKHPSMVHSSVRFADMVFCLSNAVAEMVLNRGTSPQRIRLLPNRINRSIFHRFSDDKKCIPSISKFPKGKSILHVGRKSYEKNIDTVIAALALLPQEYFAVFIGRGSNEKYVRLACKAGVNGRCYWFDSVPNNELPYWYSWCDCMCTPSRWEGFGIVFIEAAACGSAIITSDIAPMNEYLKHGENAHLVKDYENGDAIANAIRKVCEDDAYRQKLSIAAEKSPSVFDRDQIDILEANLYKEVLSLPQRKFTLTEMAAYRAWYFRYHINNLFTSCLKAVLNIKKKILPI